MLKVDQRQQEAIAQFYQAKENIYKNSFGARFVGYFMLIIAELLFILPLQEWDEVEVIFVFFYLMQMNGVMYYLREYKLLWDKKGTQKIYPMIKACPVSKTQLCIYEMKKVFGLCIVIVGITVVGQSLIAIFAYHNFSFLLNVVVPLLLQLFVPMLLVFLEWKFQR